MKPKPMINIQIQDIEILFNTIKDLYNYELNRADKDKLLSEITKRAENPRLSKIINLTIGKRLIILNDSVFQTLKTWEMTVTMDHPYKPIPIPIVITFQFHTMKLQNKLNRVKSQLISVIREGTCYGVNPFKVQIISTDILPTFGIAIIKIEYQENNPGDYLESNWYNNQITDGLIGNYDLGNIEVSIVNLNDNEDKPLTQQLIIIA